MFSKFRTAALAAAFACFGSSSAAPLEAYGRLSTLSEITLSPDGKDLAYYASFPTKQVLVIQAIGVPQPLAMLNTGNAKLRGLQWADNDHLLIITSTTSLPMGLMGHRSEWEMAQYYDVAAKELKPLFEHPAGLLDDGPQTMNVIAGEPEPRNIGGHTVVFAPGIYFPGEEGRYALFAQDLTAGYSRMVSGKNNTHAEDWVVDGAGKIAAESDYYEDQQRWKLRVYRNGDADNAIDVAAAIEGPEIEGLSEDGTGIVVGLPQTGNRPPFEKISFADGSASPWHPELDLDDLMTDDFTGRVIGGPRFTEKSDYVFLDPHSEMVWRSVKAAFKDATDLGLISWSQDWTKLVVLAFGPAYGDTYFYVDMLTHNASPIGSAYEGITDVAPEKWIDYKAADGRVIHAYLTLPLGRDPKNLPLVVLPHGGPHSRDKPGFDWLSQAIASRGYVVLQPEFRGSAGFDTALLTAGFGEFGHKMQTDLSDGVRALAVQGIIDPKRVCIVGASYGGYAALAGATLDTGVYRCAVSISGLSDLRAQLKYWHWPHDSLDDRSERFWDRFLGVQDLDDPKLDQISPIKHVDKVTIPILLIHGKDDTVVPFSQSDDMYDALKEAGKEVEFVKLDGEDHWLSRGETRLQMLQATVKFLEANNPPN